MEDVKINSRIKHEGEAIEDLAFKVLKKGRWSLNHWRNGKRPTKAELRREGR